MGVSWPQSTRFLLRVGAGSNSIITSLLLLELRIKLLAQRRYLQLDLILPDIIILELHPEFHAFHFDASLALMLEDGCIWLGVSNIRSEGTEDRSGCLLVEWVVARFEVGKVALNVSVGSAAPGGFKTDTVVHGVQRDSVSMTQCLSFATKRVLASDLRMDDREEGRAK